jgi:hypothetical protein
MQDPQEFASQVLADSISMPRNLAFIEDDKSSNYCSSDDCSELDVVD